MQLTLPRLAKIVLLVVPFALLAAPSCFEISADLEEENDDDDDDDDDDDNNDIVDGGPGEGEGEQDAGSNSGCTSDDTCDVDQYCLLSAGICQAGCRNDASCDEGETCNGSHRCEGGFEGEGEGLLCDGGLCEGFDGGTLQGTEYTGTVEEGVVCDQTTCAETAPCCVNFGGASLTAVCGTAGLPCDGAFASFSCDGPEDCLEGDEECCVDGNFAGSCVAAGSCATSGGNAVCVDTAGCGAEEMCCGFGGGLFPLPVDIGVCQAAASNCSVGQ